MSRPPPPGLPVVRRSYDAFVRVWYRLPPPSQWEVRPVYQPDVVSMEVHVRGGGAGGQEELERQLAALLPAGAELRGYELIA